MAQRQAQSINAKGGTVNQEIGLLKVQFSYTRNFVNRLTVSLVRNTPIFLLFPIVIAIMTVGLITNSDPLRADYIFMVIILIVTASVVLLIVAVRGNRLKIAATEPMVYWTLDSRGITVEIPESKFESRLLFAEMAKVYENETVLIISRRVQYKKTCFSLIIDVLHLDKKSLSKDEIEKVRAILRQRLPLKATRHLWQQA